MEKVETIRIAGIIRESIVDGPGIRFAIFCQGCPHHCDGCHNPESHDYNGGYDCSIEKILTEIDKNPLLKGVTFSGGEPFVRAKEFAYIGEKLHERGLDVTTFTGYTYEQLLEMDNDDFNALLSVSDLLIDGKYEKDKRDLTLRFRGSQNQRIIDLNKTRKEGVLVLAEEYM